MRIEKNIPNRIKVDKLAVFDLDGTLYKCNSHIEVINKKYNTKFFNSIFSRIIGKLFRKMHIKILYYLYNKIPVTFISEFAPQFRKSALDLLIEKQLLGYRTIIVSNAPNELIKSAATRLNIEWLRAEIGYKNDVVKDNYDYDILFVCTDNVSDMNLLDIAQEQVIYVKWHTKNKFVKKYPNAQILEE